MSSAGVRMNGLRADRRVHRGARALGAHRHLGVGQPDDALGLVEDRGAGLLLERLVHLEGVLVEADRLGDAVVGADDRRVAAGVAGRDVVGLEDGDVRDPVAGREVVGGRQAVPAAADDDDVVASTRRSSASGSASSVSVYSLTTATRARLEVVRRRRACGHERARRRRGEPRAWPARRRSSPGRVPVARRQRPLDVAARCSADGRPAPTKPASSSTMACGSSISTPARRGRTPRRREPQDRDVAGRRPRATRRVERAGSATTRTPAQPLKRGHGGPPGRRTASA